MSRILRRCLKVFHDCAAFLTFSIQVAAIVILVQVDFGFDASSMGDATARITEAVSLLTLLPLSYTIILLRASSDGEILRQEPTATTGIGDLGEEDRNFGLFVLCWILSLYPFYSKMNSDFGPSKIGAPSSDEPAPVISDEQFGIIKEICFQGVEVITDAENSLMTATAIIAFVPLSLLVLGRVIFLAIRKHHMQPGSYMTRLAASKDVTLRRLRQFLTLTLGMIPLLACGLLWTIFRVQRLQKQMASANGNDYVNSQWTFGQIVAVTVFTPVLSETYHLFRKS